MEKEFPVHTPVLKKEVLEYFGVKANENFVDCTIGEGGHAKAILEKNGPKGLVLGIERDRELFEKILCEKIERLILVNGNFSDLEKIVKEKDFKKIKGVLFDLGISSWHLEKSKRGFSFQRNEILDMRYDQREKQTAMEVVNQWPKEKIEKILRDFGQERFAKKIASEIEKERKIKKIETTLQLVEVIKRATPSWYHHQRIHFATKTFQALRIAVNKELENLRVALPQALKVLERNGVLIVISFHSLEDRIVKNFLKDNFKKGLLKILTKKPITPSPEEIKKNPRARSAKLRAAIKT